MLCTRCSGCRRPAVKAAERPRQEWFCCRGAGPAQAMQQCVCRTQAGALRRWLQIRRSAPEARRAGRSFAWQSLFVLPLCERLPFYRNKEKTHQSVWLWCVLTVYDSFSGAVPRFPPDLGRRRWFRRRLEGFFCPLAAASASAFADLGASDTGRRADGLFAVGCVAGTSPWEMDLLPPWRRLFRRRPWDSGLACGGSGSLGSSARMTGSTSGMGAAGSAF